MIGDWLDLQPPPPLHAALLQSNELMPEIQGKKRALTGLPSRFQVSLLLPTKLGQPMHSQSALTELPSPNLAPFILLDPVFMMGLLSLFCWRPHNWNSHLYEWPPSTSSVHPSVGRSDRGSEGNRKHHAKKKSTVTEMR